MLASLRSCWRHCAHVGVTALMLASLRSCWRHCGEVGVSALRLASLRSCWRHCVEVGVSAFSVASPKEIETRLVECQTGVWAVIGSYLKFGVKWRARGRMPHIWSRAFPHFGFHPRLAGPSFRSSAGSGKRSGPGIGHMLPHADVRIRGTSERMPLPTSRRRARSGADKRCATHAAPLRRFPHALRVRRASEVVLRWGKRGRVQREVCESVERVWKSGMGVDARTLLVDTMMSSGRSRTPHPR
eukprot:354247-Chlamydomonas_euryale.AAC.2